MFNKFLRILMTFMFCMQFLIFPVSESAWASINYVRGVTPKTKPKTSQTKRQRLTTESIKDWRGKSKNKNVIKFLISNNCDWDTIKIKLGDKRDLTFKQIVIKEKIKGVTSFVEVFRGSDVFIAKGSWKSFYKQKTGDITVPNSAQTKVVKIILKKGKENGKKRKPKIQEIRIEQTQGAVYNNKDHVLLVGSPYYDDVLDEGRTDFFVFPGSSSIDFNAVMTNQITGSVQEGNMGYFITPIGDMNLDGYRDHLIASTGPAGANVGNVDIIYGGDYDPSNVSNNPPGFGGSTMLNGPSNTSVTGTAGSRMGASACPIFNFDGNRNMHLAIGAPSDPAGGNDRGLVEIYPASSNFLSGSPDFTVLATLNFTFIGESSASGDCNGDGFGDVFLGAATPSGNVWGYLGSSSPDVSSPHMIFSGSLNSNFGSDITVCDINGDGYDDLISGAPNANSNLGEVNVFLGSSSFDTNSDLTIAGSKANGQFGRTVECLGDVNGDGISDLGVSAPGADSKNGDVSIFFGGSNFPNDSVVLSGSGAECFGTTLRPIGDVDSDGDDDFFVGAPCANSETGAGYLVEGDSTTNNIQAQSSSIFQGANNGDHFGEEQDKVNTL